MDFHISLQNTGQYFMGPVHKIFDRKIFPGFIFSLPDFNYRLFSIERLNLKIYPCKLPVVASGGLDFFFLIWG